MAIFIGKPCVKCGSTERYESTGACASCARASAAKWKKANAVRHKQWDRKNPEKVREYKKKWAKENPKKILARIAKQYKKNPEKYRDKSARWRKANPEKVREMREIRIDGLADSYVATTLRMSVKDCPPELIEAKREQLQLKRLIKQLKEKTK